MAKKNAKQTAKRNIGVLIFSDAEVLDITGPHEVFAMALAYQQQQNLSQLYNVFLISKTLKPVTMSSGMKIHPDYCFDDCPSPLDILIVSGGESIDQALHDQVLLDWIKQQSFKVRRLVSICTGAFFLAKLGLLNGKRVTTHWGFVLCYKRCIPN